MDYSRFTEIDAILDNADDYFEEKHYKESLPYIDEAIKEIVLYEAETWFYKARALRFAGHLKEAFECFNKAVELAPGNTEYQEMRQHILEEEIPKDMQQGMITLKNNTDKLLKERLAVQKKNSNTYDSIFE